MSAVPPAIRRRCWPGSPSASWPWRRSPASRARQSAHLREAGTGNAVVIEGPLADGVPAEAPFDAILLNGAVPAVATRSARSSSQRAGGWSPCLREGPLCRAYVWQRSGKTIDRQPAFEGAAEPLPGFEVPAEFVF